MRKISSTGLVSAAVQVSDQDTGKSSASVKPIDPIQDVELAKDKVPPVPGKKTEITRRDYGIEEAIKLMRRMPDSDMMVLAKIVKECLESTNIRIANIIKDAETKEARLEEQIKKLDSEIEDLESMITHRQGAIQTLVHDLDETRQVKNQLSLAEGSHDLGIESNRAKESPSPANTGESSSQSSRNQSTAMLLDSLFGDSQGTHIKEENSQVLQKKPRTQAQ